MHEDQARILRLTQNLNVILGGLEMINTSPESFNKTGVKFLIDLIKIMLEWEKASMHDLTRAMGVTEILKQALEQMATSKDADGTEGYFGVVAAKALEEADKAWSLQDQKNF